MYSGFNGLHYRTGQSIQLQVDGARWQNVAVTGEPAQPNLPFVAPGLVDLQINGYQGDDFNTLPLQVSTVVRMTRALWSEGVTAYMPTVITHHADAIEQAVSAIASACEQDALVEASIVGIHLEGPFISPEDGPRGAHDRSYIQPPSWKLMNRWQTAAKGRIRLITLSPEWEEAAAFIRTCTVHGIQVSIGHTAATPEQIQQAVQCGAVMSTHLGNGAHLMLPRHPNYLWEQLAQDALWTCCIADGFHLPDSLLKVIMKVKKERAILVSDAVSLCGLAPGRYQTHVGGEVVLTACGRLHLAENPDLLAGSAQMLKWGIEHVTSKGLTTLDEAWDMASLHPARVMKLPGMHGLAAGAAADAVWFVREETGIHIVQTMKSGQIVYQSDRLSI
ncbi:N-acetylglucosamine-6-phosphate deacetylase [Marinicrinis sediminis]|uniref:N-acetylglucosamine-6-phosphate deacetylase n=1 Tax=Marinicrinis sediminis TaxID=1652465 RepID=A0ABW5R8Q1_9BACL